MHRVIVHQPGCRNEDPRIAFRANDCYGLCAQAAAAV